MAEKWCQSCAMPMNDEMYGYNADSSKNEDYCKYCFENGKFTQECTMEEMAEICVPHMTKQGMSEDEARKIMSDCLPKLKRWQETSKPKGRCCCRK